MDLEIDPATGLIESPAGTGMTLMEMMALIEEHDAPQSRHRWAMFEDCPSCHKELNAAMGWTGAIPTPGGG